MRKSQQHGGYTGVNMYKIIIGNDVYRYDNEKDARKAYHIAVAENGINNVRVSYE